LFAVEALSHGRGEVCLVDDVVAVEHAPRLPAAEPHDLALRYTCLAKVARRAPAQIVDEPPDEPRAFACALPRGPHGPDAQRLAIPMEHVHPIARGPPGVEQRRERRGWLCSISLVSTFTPKGRCGARRAHC